MKDEHQKLFIESFIALASLYKDVKEILILAENIDPGQSLYLGPINELRNALDHVMRAFLNYDESPSISSTEISKIKEHLLRAGYDGYEIIATTLIQQIQDSPITRFETEVITKVFPEYYIRYKPELVAIKVALKDVRANKTPDRILEKAGNNDFKGYLKQINKLIVTNETISGYIPELQTAQESKDHSKNNDRKWDVLKLIVVAIVAALLALTGNSIVKSYVPDGANKVAQPMPFSKIDTLKK